MLLTHLWFWLTIYTLLLARPLLWRAPLSQSDRDAGRWSYNSVLPKKNPRAITLYKSWQRVTVCSGLPWGWFAFTELDQFLLSQILLCASYCGAFNSVQEWIR